MMMTIDIEEAPARWRELIAEVEAGNEVVIARNAQPLVRMAKVEQPSTDVIEDPIAALRANRKNFAPITIEEIIEWKNEGRR